MKQLIDFFVAVLPLQVAVLHAAATTVSLPADSQHVGYTIGVARIFSGGGHFLLDQKSDDLF